MVSYNDTRYKNINETKNTPERWPILQPNSDVAISRWSLVSGDELSGVGETVVDCSTYIEKKE